MCKTSRDFKKYRTIWIFHISLKLPLYISVSLVSVVWNISKLSWKLVQLANKLAVSRRFYNLSPIWCLDFLDNLILIGCADGRLEFWEGTTGSIKCIYENQTTYSNGVTNIKLAGDKLIVARLNGRLDFLRLETFIFFLLRILTTWDWTTWDWTTLVVKYECVHTVWFQRVNVWIVGKILFKKEKPIKKWWNRYTLFRRLLTRLLFSFFFIY
jgi:WD40 repeat protein